MFVCMPFANAAGFSIPDTGIFCVRTLADCRTSETAGTDGTVSVAIGVSLLLVIFCYLTWLLSIPLTVA